MKKIFNRPDYINYICWGIDNNEVTNKAALKRIEFERLEVEDALVEWVLPRAFLWHTSAWEHHLKLSILVIVPFIFIIFMNGISMYALGWIVILFLPFSFIYYIARSQYHHMAYKITESGLLVDVLKIYPKFRYKRQDTTKVINFLRIVSIISIVAALFINPLLLAGAGAAVFLSFMEPTVDEGEEAIYSSYVFNQQKINKIKTHSKRKLIYLDSFEYTSKLEIHCTKENFDKVLQIIQKNYPNVECTDDLYKNDY